MLLTTQSPVRRNVSMTLFYLCYICYPVTVIPCTVYRVMYY